MKSLRLIAAVVFLFMMTAIVADDSYALWGRKKFFVQIVDEDGNPITDASARAMVNDTAIYHDASIWESETSATAASQAPLTVGSTTGVAEFWGKANSYNIRVTRDGKWDVFKNVGTTTHKLVFLGRNMQVSGLGTSPESAPGMFMLDYRNRLYIGLGSFGNATWDPLSP